MTDSPWSTADDPGPLLDAAAGRATDRQLRLFACACARSVWGFVPDGPCRDAVEVALRFADGQASADELAAARAAAIRAAGRGGLHAAAAWAACETTAPSARKAARASATEAREQLRRQSRGAAEDEARLQAGFLRDIVGDPDLDKRADPAGRLGTHPTVREIAEGLYAGGPEEDQAALADTLEALGCRSVDLLDHLRSPGPHVRGCWAIDVLLGHEATLPPEPEPEPEPEPAPPEAPARPRRSAVPLPSLGPVPVPARGEPGRAAAIREALSRALGPKKYRRFLRKAVGQAPGPGQVARPPEWDAFVRLYPELAVGDDELVEVCAVCLVHDRRLEERTVRAAAEDLARLQDPRFLENRSRQFPHAFPAERPAPAGEPERAVWWCPECQRERVEWFGAPFGTNPKTVLNEAGRLAREGQYAEALERHLWHHEHALALQPSLRGVRLSFALGAWLDLGEQYPPARAALIATRDRRMADLRAGNWTADGFQDAAALNHQLGEEAATGALFLDLRQADPALARKVVGLAVEGLIALGEYEVLGECLADPVGHLSWFAARRLLESPRHSPGDPAGARVWFRERVAERVNLLVELLERAGRKADADRTREAATALSAGSGVVHRITG